MQKGHLLFARTLETLGEDENALREFEEVAKYYPGEEASCRHALLLKKMGRIQEANEEFNKIILRSRMRGRRNTSKERHWIRTAQENIESNASSDDGGAG